MKSNQTQTSNLMDNISLIRETLKPHLKWHGARLSFLALFRISLFRVKTVNLAELSTGFMGNAKIESNAGLLPHRLLRRLERIRVRKGYKDFFESLILIIILSLS